MDTVKFKDIVIEMLKQDERIWNESKTEFNQSLLFDLIDKIDETIINILLENKETRKTFFAKIKDVYVFKTNDFKFFMEENKINNSFTRFENKIGLSAGQELIKSTNEVVLDFPFKDCVLEGGQSTEEGMDIYYEYEKEKTRTVQGEKLIEPAGYKGKQAKRNEVFFNQVLARDEIDRLLDDKALVNWKRYTRDGEQPVADIKRDEKRLIRDNLIIRGNNLLALHSLESQFAGRVKLIYIDPPYNTGKDSFVYNDRFNHATWLTFMKNRLDIAKKLLSPAGVIIVHCDFIEEHYIKVLMDEMFGKNMFINNISIRDSHPSGLKLSAKTKTIIKTKSTMLLYKKNYEIAINPIYQSRKDWDVHFNSYIDIDNKSLPKYTLSEYLLEQGIIDDEFKLDGSALQNEQFRDFAFKNRNKIFQSTKEISDEGRELSLDNMDRVVQYEQSEFAYNGRRLSPLSKSIYNVGFDGYYYEDFGKLICDFWDDVDFNNSQNEGRVSFPSGKKPEYLLAKLLTMFTNKSDIVLDYHLGSGTTCAVAHKMGRQYIGIEQIDYGDNDSVVRIQNVINGDATGISRAVNWQGGGDFIYCELAKWNEIAKEEINNCERLTELDKLFGTLCEKYFLNYNVKIDEFKNKLIKEDEFIALSLEEQKRMFLTMLDLNQMYVQRTEMADSRYGISKEDQELTRQFYEGE